MNLETKLFIFIFAPIMIAFFMFVDGTQISYSDQRVGIYVLLGLSAYLGAIAIIRHHIQSRFARILGSSGRQNFEFEDVAQTFAQQNESHEINRKLARDSVEKAPFPVLKLNTKLEVTSASKSGLAAFGADVIGKSIDDVFDDQAMTGSVKLAQNNDHELSIKFQFVKTLKDYEVFIIPISWQTENLCVILYFKDISESAEIDTKLRNFSVNFAHEMKTPITAILTAAETLRTMDPSERDGFEEFTNIIINQSKKLTKLTNDISKLQQSNKVENFNHEVNIKEIVNRAVMKLQAKLSGNNVKISIISASPKLPLISGNDAQLVDAIYELVDNAINYAGSDKQITVRMRAVRHNSTEPAFRLNDGKALKLSIIDQGDGLSPHKMQKITDIFYKADESRAGNKNNFGVGLSLVAKVVSNHKAELKVNTKKGVGSEFSIYFPVHKSED